MASSSSHPASSGSSDVALPKALTDFIFDLYDSVTMSQDSVEQAKLYGTEFRDLSTKYFGHQPWPSPQSIASECNGDPLFLAVYREMTHRHWHQVVLSRPSIRDRLEGFAVYRELFDEILEAAEDANFELLPTWVFDIFQEFGYQFQGFCQVRSAVYASARKHGWITVDEDTHTVTLSPAATAALSNPSSNNNSNNNNNNTSNLLDNLTVLEQNRDAWDVEIVFSYLHRFAELGLPTSTMTSLPPVYTYFNMFATLTKSRLECLLGDFTASLQALTPLSVHASLVIPSHTTDATTKTTSGRTVAETLESVVAAKLSLSYHCSISLMMLRRYKDAARLLGQVCATVLRGFKTGQLRKVPGSEQFHKQVERMLSLLALLHYVLLGHATTTTTTNSRNKRSPTTTTTTTDEWMDDAVARVLRDKHAARLEATSSYEEWFASPKFVTTNYTTTTHNVHKHLVQVFLRDIPAPQTHRTVASYLQLYTTLPLSKLTLFYQSEQDEAKKQSKTNPKNTTTTTATATTDATTTATRTSQEDMMALVLSYKLRHWQWEHVAPPASTNISWLLWNYDQHKGRKDALELHFHIQADKDQKSMTLCMLEEDDDETDDSKDTTTTNKNKTTMSNQYYKTMQRRHYYETYFVSRLEQSVELRQWLQRPSLDPSDVVRAATAVGSSS